VKGFWFIMAGAWVQIMWGHHVAALCVTLALELTGLAIGVRGMIKDGRIAQIKRARDRQVQHIRTMEEELGYSPLELGEIETDKET